MTTLLLTRERDNFEGKNGKSSRYPDLQPLVSSLTTTTLHLSFEVGGGMPPTATTPRVDDNNNVIEGDEDDGNTLLDVQENEDAQSTPPNGLVIYDDVELLVDLYLLFENSRWIWKGLLW